jgi:nucleoside-diphosphate-sugar epimerase
MKTIAILGATGHIGRSLAVALASDFRLALFARRPGDCAAFAKRSGIEGPALTCYDLETPFPNEAAMIVNAIGPGDPRAIRETGDAIAAITDRFDNQVLEHLERHPKTAYAFISTGAVYGTNYDDPDRPSYLLETPPAMLSPAELYPRAKLVAETRHRERYDLHIADIRLFGYVSRFLDPDGGSLMAEIAHALIDRTPFSTDSTNFVRDYISARELAGLIKHLLDAGTPNGTYDAVSAAPATKSSFLKALTVRCGLKTQLTDGATAIAELQAPEFISFHETGRSIGYTAQRSSIETVIEEILAMLLDIGEPARFPQQSEQDRMVLKVPS